MFKQAFFVKHDTRETLKEPALSSSRNLIQIAILALIYRAQHPIMKRLITTLLLINCVCFLYAQNNKNDSLKRLIAATRSNEDKVLLTAKLAHNYVYYKPDTAFLLVKNGLIIAKKTDFLQGEAACYKVMGEALEGMGDYPGAMNAYLKHLRIAETLNMQFDIAKAFLNIGYLYEDQDEYRLSVNYKLRAKNVIDAITDKSMANYDLTRDVILIDIGYGYYNLNMLDSALTYEQDGYELALKIHNDDNMGDILQNLGLIQEKYNNKPLAITYYRMSVQKSEAVGDSTTLTDTYIRLADFYKTSQKTDSCIFYADKALATAKSALYIKGVLDASTILANIYGLSNKSLAYDYLKTATTAKDSLFNKEKVKQLQNLKFEEQNREQEVSEIKAQQAEERKNNLQLTAIALFIPVFFLIALVLSKIKIHHRVIEYMSVLSILFLFEFITLLLHPMIGEFTNHTPVVEFVIFVCFAGIMVPMHHRLTHWLTERLSHVQKWGKNHLPEVPKKTEEHI